MEQINCAGESVGMDAVKQIRCLEDGRLFVVLRDGRKFVGTAGEELQPTVENLDPFAGKKMRRFALTPDGPKEVISEVEGQVSNTTAFGEGGRIKMDHPTHNK